MSFDINGVDDLADKLDEMQQDIKKLDGENNVPLNELFSNQFMEEYTEVDTLEVFFDQSPWTVESQEDLEAISDNEFDEYVNEHTVFETGDEMGEKAGKEWVAKQIGL